MIHLDLQPEVETTRFRSPGHGVALDRFIEEMFQARFEVQPENV